jgi:phosphotransferase system  glucose/maltose/N-acetylglucosamine-specific IIC component|nr:MAG TPA: Cytadhesin P30/P32 [Caudoviricetes sp.]
MLDNIFWFFMGIIGNIVKFIIVSGIIGFILLLPFLLKGGWLLGIIIYGFLFICIGTFLVDKHNQNKDHFEEMMKRREEFNERSKKI